MEQTNSLAMNMLQSIASQAAGIPKSGKSDSGDELSDFQKLLDEKAQEKDPLMEQPPKTEAKAPAKKTEKAPAKTEEDPIEASKKAQVVVVGQLDPEAMPDPVIRENPMTGEELTIIQGDWAPQIWTYEADLEEIAGDPNAMGEGMQPIDVSDPEADAILEATAPGADDSPAAMLEEIVDEQIGQVAQKAVEEIQPQGEEDDDGQVEILDAEQAPQRIFHDVKSVPVKVGEAEAAEQPDEPNVAQQIDSQLIQALRDGESMVRVQLTPENLGTVTVEISQSAQGILRIALSAHSTETRALLERHAGELQGLLSSRTQQTVEVDVQRQQESQQSQQHQNYEGHNGHAQDGQERRRQQREHTSSQDFMQQLRLGLIPTDGGI